MAEAGLTVVLPAAEGMNCWVFIRLYLTGTGTVTLAAHVVRRTSQVRF